MLIARCIVATMLIAAVCADVDSSSLSASFAQRALVWDLPLPIAFTAWHGTHNSYNNKQSTGNVFESPHNQALSLTAQLQLGAREIEIDCHRIAAQSNKLSVCHTSEGAAKEMQAKCALFGWASCQVQGIYDYGPNTGCHPNAPTLFETLMEVATWQSQSTEVLIISFDGGIDGPDVDAAFSEALDVRAIFTPKDLGTGPWPTVRQLIARGFKTVIRSTSLDTPNSVFLWPQNTNSAELTTNWRGTCTPAAPLPWGRIQGDATRVTLFGTVYYNGPVVAGLISPGDTRSVMACGDMPIFDQFNADLFKATIWSWSNTLPDSMGAPRCAIMVQSGSWQIQDCSMQARSACLSATATTRVWLLSNNAVAGNAPQNAVQCPTGSLPSTPITASDNGLLAMAVNAASVPGVWINYQSPSAGCWARGELAPICEDASVRVVPVLTAVEQPPAGRALVKKSSCATHGPSVAALLVIVMSFHIMILI